MWADGQKGGVWGMGACWEESQWQQMKFAACATGGCACGEPIRHAPTSMA